MSRTKSRALLSSLALTLSAAFVSCAPEEDESVSQHEQDIFIGNISAINYADATAQQQEWATATGIMTFRWRLTELGGDCPDPATGNSFDCSVDVEVLNAQDIVDAGGTPLCAHGPSANAYPDELKVDPACTAFLIGPDTFATAAHCLTPNDQGLDTIGELLECKNMSVVMRWRQSDGGSFPNGNPRVLERHVYHCTEVLAHGRDMNGWQLPATGNRNSDWALFRVDREVSGGTGTGGPLTPEREPFSFEVAPLTNGEAGLTTIGHPHGHPTKIDPEVSVHRSPSPHGPGTFTINGDVAGGLSGGPVLDPAGNVVGIVSGAPSLTRVLDPRWPTSDTVRPNCGNGVREGTEECDDDNEISGDGCSDNCEKEQFCEMECFPPGDSDPTCAFLVDYHPVAVSAQCVNGNPGGANFCTEECPCQSGAGDCDNEDQCQGDLVCANDYGSAFRQKPGRDVCVPAGCEDRNVASGSFCSKSCPCGYGGADCDLKPSANNPNNQCMVGLVCANDYGPHFGASPTADVCVTPKCADRTPGSAEFCTEECPCGLGGGACADNSRCMPGLACADNYGGAFSQAPDSAICVKNACVDRTRGSGSFCSETCLCGYGGGDCDLGSAANPKNQCMRGMVCALDYGDNFGASKTTDICVKQACADRSPGTAHFCTEECPCGVGGGDCDTNSECMPGLKCKTNLGKAFGRPNSQDICVDKACTQQKQSRLGAGDFCSPSCPCGEGGGDCDTNADCMGNLKCTHDVGADYGYAANIDVCTE